MRLVAIPEREPGTKIIFKVWDSNDSLDQLGINDLLVILLEVWQIVGWLQGNREDLK